MSRSGGSHWDNQSSHTVLGTRYPVGTLVGGNGEWLNGLLWNYGRKNEKMCTCKK